MATKHTAYLALGLSTVAALAWTPVGTTTDAMLGSDFHFTIPCDNALVGLQWWLQGIDAFTTTGGCSLGGGVDFTLTDTVRTQVGS